MGLLYAENMKKGKASLLQTQIQNNKRLGTIIDRILEYHGKTREAVAEYCKAAIEEGFTGIEAWDYLSIKLKDKVAKSTLYDWGNKYLPEGSMKVTKPNGSTTKIPESESSKSERSLPQKQLEQKQQEEGRPGKTNQGADEYRIDKLHEYDEDYKDEVIEYLHEIKEKNLTQYTVYDELELDPAQTGIMVSCSPPDTGEGGEIREVLSCAYLPVVIHVDVLQQTATVVLDEDAHENVMEQTYSKPEPESKPKRSKTKKHD